MANEMVLRVASGSNPSSVAGSLVKNIQEGKEVTLVAVGAGACNQAIKAIAIGRGYIAPHGVDLLTRVGFEDIQIEGDSKTAIRLQIVKG